MKPKIKNGIIVLIKFILIFVILLGIYFAIMTLTSLIPSGMLENNVRESSETLVQEGEKVTFDLKYKEENIFTFTDALMINTAYSIDNNHPIESFILARKNYIPGQTTEFYPDGQYNLGANENYISKENGDLYQTKELYGLMHNDGNTEGFEYPRYWHGYLAILRPLLLLFDYNTIRWLSCICLVILSIALAVILVKKINKITGFIFLASLLIVNIFIAGLCLNEATTYYIAIIASIVLALWYKKIKNNILLYF